MPLRKVGIISGQYTFSAMEEGGFVSLTKQPEEYILIEVNSKSFDFHFFSPYDSNLLVVNAEYQFSNVTSYNAADAVVRRDILTPQGIRKRICDVFLLESLIDNVLLMRGKSMWILEPNVKYSFTGVGHTISSNSEVGYLRLLCTKALFTEYTTNNVQ